MTRKVEGSVQTGGVIITETQLGGDPHDVYVAGKTAAQITFDSLLTASQGLHSPEYEEYMKEAAKQNAEGKSTVGPISPPETPRR